MPKVRSNSRGAWKGSIGGGDFEMILMSRIGLSAIDQSDRRVVLNSEVRRVRCDLRLK